MFLPPNLTVDIAQSHNKNNCESNDWVDEDITAITRISQHAHIHKSATSGNVLVFPRDTQGTAALITATAN